MLLNKYNLNISSETISKNSLRLTNQLWKLIPMKENGEDWQKQLDIVILEMVGLNEIFEGSTFLQILSKLEGLKVKGEDINFDFYRTTVFKCISLLKEV